MLHFRNIARWLNLFLGTSNPTSGRMEFPGRFERCLRAEGSSGIVASKEGLVILTQDLDFSQILFETAASGPSTILLRLGDELNFGTRRRVAGIILQCRSEIESGALLVIDEQKNRLRMLPLR
jgi:hypothetical protein